MRGISPVVAGILVAGVAIAVALSGYYWIQSMEVSTASSGSAAVATIATLPPEVGIAKVTTPYTWEVWVRNPNSAPMSMEGVTSYLIDADGQICAFSDGFVADSNVVPANSVKKFVFYGWNKCKIPKNRENWLVRVVFGPGRESRVVTPVSSEDMGLVLWIPFESVWDFDWSGNDLDVHYYDEEFQGTLHGVNNGAVHGAQWVEGKKGKALEFDGVDDYVEVPHSTSLSIGRTFTVEFWTKPTTLTTASGNPVLINKNWDIGDPRWAIWFEKGTGTLHFDFIDSSGKRRNTVSITKLSPGEWYHIVGVYDGKYSKLFINGKLEAQTDQASNDFSNIGNIIIGNRDTNKPNYEDYHGIIDEVRIYNRALSEEEIQKLYRGEDVREGLVLYLPFDEGTGTTAYDWHNWSEEGMWFDGNGDGVNIGSLPALGANPANRDYTVTARVIPYDTSQEQRIFGDGCQEMGLRISSSGKLCAVSYVAACAPNPVTAGKEYFVANVTTVDNNTVHLYVNGKLTASSTWSGSYNGWNDPPFTIGYDPSMCGDGSHYYFRGIIREIRVYNRALSPEEIRCIYSDPDCLTDDENLVVMYTFREPCTTYYPDTRKHTDKVCRAPPLRKDTDRKKYVEFKQGWNNEFWIDAFDTPQTGLAVLTVTSITSALDTPSATMIRKEGSFMLDGWTSNTPVFSVYDTAYRGTSFDPLTEGKWYVLGGLAIPIDEEFKEYMFQNGKYWTSGVTVTKINNTVAPLGIGNWYSEFYNGKMKAVMIFSKPVDPTDLNALCKLFKAC